MSQLDIAPEGDSVLPQATALNRFGAEVLEYAIALVTLGLGCFVRSLVLIGKALTPALRVLELRENRQTLWEQISGTSVGFQKK